MVRTTSDQQTPQLITTGGTSTNYTATFLGLTAYGSVTRVTVKPHTDCLAGPVTININGFGAKTIKRDDGSNLSAGDLQQDGVYDMVYDLTQDFFFLVGRIVTSGGGGGLLVNLSNCFIHSGGGNGFGWVGTGSSWAGVAADCSWVSQGGFEHHIGLFDYIVSGGGIMQLGLFHRTINQTTGVYNAYFVTFVASGVSGFPNNLLIAPGFMRYTFPNITVNYSYGAIGFDDRKRYYDITTQTLSAETPGYDLTGATPPATILAGTTTMGFGVLGSPYFATEFNPVISLV